MFFSDYLIANMLVVFSMYHVMKCSGSAGSEKGHVFFASFFVVLAAWFVPSAVVFLLAVYMGIVLFSAVRRAGVADSAGGDGGFVCVAVDL